MNTLQIKSNVWVEKDGQVLISRWRVALLQAVHETGSISAAAQRMGVPYHRAWDKIHECEERLGVSLLSTQTGGAGGGGARLTAEGLDLVNRFQAFNRGLDELICARFVEAFGPTPFQPPTPAPDDTAANPCEPPPNEESGGT